MDEINIIIKISVMKNKTEGRPPHFITLRFGYLYSLLKISLRDFFSNLIFSIDSGYNLNGQLHLILKFSLFKSITEQFDSHKGSNI